MHGLNGGLESYSHEASGLEIEFVPISRYCLSGMTDCLLLFRGVGEEGRPGIRGTTRPGVGGRAVPQVTLPRAFLWS
jgi:hypothetical protein